MALLLAKAKMGPKRLKRATAVRFWCSWYPTQYFWIRPVILDRFQGPGRSFSDQKLGLKSKSGFSGHPRYLRPKLRTSDQNALKQTGSEGPQNLSMGFWHVKHQFYLPAQKCSNLTHPSVYVLILCSQKWIGFTGEKALLLHLFPLNPCIPLSSMTVKVMLHCILLVLNRLPL